MHAFVGVNEQYVEVVVDSRALSRDGDIGKHSVGHAEEKQRLINDMSPKILDNSGSGPRLFLVCLWTQLGPVAREGQTGFHDIAQTTLLQHATNRLEIAVPAAVVKYGELASPFLRELLKRGRFLGGAGECLFGDHVFAVFKDFAGIFVVRGRRRIDDHQVYPGVRQNLLQALIARC